MGRLFDLYLVSVVEMGDHFLCFFLLHYCMLLSVSVLSVVIEEVHFLMRQRESAAILLLFTTVQKSHYSLKCLIHTRFHSMCTSEGQCNVSSAHWEREDMLCCYNCDSDYSQCVSQCFTRWLCCSVQLVNTQINFGLQASHSHSKMTESAEAVAADVTSKRSVTIEISNVTKNYCLINPR